MSLGPILEEISRQLFHSSSTVTGSNVIISKNFPLFSKTKDDIVCCYFTDAGTSKETVENMLNTGRYNV
jgi:hypothetical protein